MNTFLPDHVLQFGTARSSKGRRFGAFVRTNRFALVGAVLITVVIPELLHPIIARQYPELRLAGILPFEPELYISAAAVLAAHLALRRVGILPFVNDKIIILPTFMVSFGIAIAFLTLVLRHYGHYHLLTSFVGGVTWYYIVALLRRRTKFPRLAFVGEMAPDDEMLDASVDWLPLAHPKLPRDVLGVVFDSETEPSPAWERFFSRTVLRNIPVYDLAQLREMITGRVRLRLRPELVFGQLLPSQPYLRLKRLTDTILAVPALVLATPVLVIAGILIRLESPGPALFTQQRIGFQGKKFTCYKLRSMRVGMRGPAYTCEADPRITTVGRFIRKTRIDELPQIFNVLKGDMSWIGPRPEAKSLARQYQSHIPYYAYRHAVRPGITGWAAVHQGNVALADAATIKLEYDFYYIKYFSIWLDFLIVLMTIRTVVTGRGSR